MSRLFVRHRRMTAWRPIPSQRMHPRIAGQPGFDNLGQMAQNHLRASCCKVSLNFTLQETADITQLHIPEASLLHWTEQLLTAPSATTTTRDSYF